MDTGPILAQEAVRVINGDRLRKDSLKPSAGRTCTFYKPKLFTIGLVLPKIQNQLGITNNWRVLFVKKRALLSVSDKNGVLEFAKELKHLGYEILSTGGTMKHLAENGVAVTAVDEVTGFPEIMEGRVKTVKSTDSRRISWQKKMMPHIKHK